MNRRHFFGTLAAGFALTATPRWVQTAFAAEPSSKTLVFDAYRRARRSRRPLLIFIIPADPGERWHRGHAIGAFITHATDQALAPLALCEVACATAAHVHLLVPKAPAGEPLAILVDTTAVPAAIDAIESHLESLPTMTRSSYETWRAETNKVVEGNIIRIGSDLGKAITQRVGRADAKLAATARVRLSDHDIPGARWAHSSGCGTTFEHHDKSDDQRGMIDCGMGFVPEKSRRFLFLLAKPQTA